GYLSPSSGRVSIGGFDMERDPLKAKALIGYLPEVVPLYPEMSVYDYLKFVAALKGIPGKDHKARIDAIVERCWLTQYRNRLISHLSKGYRQRVGLAQALIHNPPVLILDEPTSGLDPKQIIQTRDLIRNLGGDHTVILSTHILPEVQNVCNRVMIINQGKVVAEDSPDRLEASLRGTQTIRLEVAGATKDQLASVINAVHGVNSVRANDKGPEFPDQLLVEVDTKPEDEVRAAVAAAVVGNGFKLYELHAARLSLEEIFLKLTTEDATAAQPAKETANV
ncbi:MAG: ATP-binding cassette domain-containing protein, partial [Candidatus Sericytochromatia bacterium]|nr:ATP-binding cassette domain-containing protein [Candidatus Tanganyikabacteria bacterium]